MSPSPVQLVIVLLIVLVLFGAGRIAGIGKGLGEGIRNFKRGIKDEEDEASTPAPPKEDESASGS